MGPPPKEIWMKFLKHKEMLNLAFIESDQEHFKNLNTLTVYSQYINLFLYKLSER